ncbi:hypothetical protein GCM10027048_18160 [Hymenobacter coalescens]
MDQSTSPDIDSLLLKSKSSGRNEDLSALWKAALSLPQWHFITKQTEKLEDRRPFVGVLEGQSWAFVFTDRQKAHEFAKAMKDGSFVDEQGTALIISSETPKAIEYIMALAAKGVHGVRINELNGWFPPLQTCRLLLNT